MSIQINLPATIVNTTITGEQNDSNITTLADGSFVVAWISHTDTTAPSSYYDSDVFGQRFDADGNPLGGEFVINGGDAERDSGPSLAATADGGFVVSWQNSATSYNQVYSGFFPPMAAFPAIF